MYIDQRSTEFLLIIGYHHLFIFSSSLIHLPHEESTNDIELFWYMIITTVENIDHWWCDRFSYQQIWLEVRLIDSLSVRCASMIVQLIYHWFTHVNSRFYSSLDSLDPEISFKLTHELQKRKRRKNRTAFSAQQIYALEKRFTHQRYLTPNDRDQIANELQLSPAQVITVNWKWNFAVKSLSMISF